MDLGTTTNIIVYLFLAVYFAAMVWRIVRALERIADKLGR